MKTWSILPPTKYVFRRRELKTEDSQFTPLEPATKDWKKRRYSIFHLKQINNFSVKSPKPKFHINTGLKTKESHKPLFAHRICFSCAKVATSWILGCRICQFCLNLNIQRLFFSLFVLSASFWIYNWFIFRFPRIIVIKKALLQKKAICLYYCHISIILLISSIGDNNATVNKYSVLSIL